VEPMVNGPFTPDLATPLSKFASFVKENGWSDELSAGLIGSCTNSSYEDMVIRTFPAHLNAVDPITDPRREPGSTSEERWSEDAGPLPLHTRI
jgi:aconitase A